MWPSGVLGSRWDPRAEPTRGEWTLENFHQRPAVEIDPGNASSVLLPVYPTWYDDGNVSRNDWL